MANDLAATLLPIPGISGRLHLSPCPGRRGGADDVRRDLAAIAGRGATRLVTLVEADELPIPLADWRDAVAAAGLSWHHLPITDYGVPDAGFEALWAEIDLPARLVAGETIAIHCRAGIGRTGTVAARLLVETAGLAPAAAIALVRSAHVATAVETAAQAAHLDDVHRRRDRPS